MGIGQMIKRAALSLAGRDDGQFSIAQAQYYNKTAEVELVFPYGYSACPPEGSLILLMNVMGQEENRAGIASYPQQRFKNLKPGEVQVGNFLTRASIKWDKAGKIYIDAPDNHVIVKSGKTIRLEADRIELAAKSALKVDVGGRGYTYYPTLTNTWEDGSLPGSHAAISPPEHNDGIPSAS